MSGGQIRFQLPACVLFDREPIGWRRDFDDATRDQPREDGMKSDADGCRGNDEPEVLVCSKLDVHRCQLFGLENR